ncbi:2436_t:CDS:2 [Entrophospora sp. SA101]|nr:2436_t:CDS:2 [Entrophospora sp. SA101]
MNCISSSSTSDLIINDSEDEIESNINDEYCVTIKEAAVETMRLLLDSDDEKPQEVNKCDGSVVDVIMIGTESNPLIINDSCEELCGELIEKEEEIVVLKFVQTNTNREEDDDYDDDDDSQDFTKYDPFEQFITDPLEGQSYYNFNNISNNNNNNNSNNSKDNNSSAYFQYSLDDLSDILNTDDNNNNSRNSNNNNNSTYPFSDDDDVKKFLENIKNTLEIYDNEFDYRIKNGFPLNSKKLKEKCKEPEPESIVVEINNINNNNCNNKKDVSDDSAMESGVEIDTSKLEPIDKLRNLQCIDFHQGSGDVNEMAFHISKFKNHEGPKLAIAYIANHDPKYNMTGNLQLFDARKGTVYYLQGHYDHHTETTNEKLWKSVTDVKFSQRGKFIYSCSTDKKVIIWSSIGKEDQICTPLATVECEDTVNRIAVKHDKSKVTYQFASCDNSGSITCFSLNADEGNSYKLDKNILQMKTKITTAPPIVDIVYGVDYFDQTIVAGFEGVESQKDGFIRLWDIETKRKLTDYKIGSNNSVSCLGMSASGYRVACGVTSTSDQVRSDGNIRLIELASSEKKMFQTNEYDSNVIAFSPDDQYIALGGVGNKVWIFDTRYENKPLRMLSHITPNDGLIYEGINGIQWINSNMILTGGSDGIVKLWNINKSENSSTCLKYEFPEHDSPITCIRADEDLNYLSVGVSTGRVYLYSTDQTVLNNRDNIRFYYHNE